MDKICTFSGHGKINYSEETYKKVISCIEQLICNEKIYNFRVGNYGSFDRLAAKAVSSLREKYPQIRLCLVVPYITSVMDCNKEYYQSVFDEILVPEFPPDKSVRAYIPLCNQYMTDSASVLVCYVKNKNGGAAETYRHALKKNIKIINIAN